MGMAAWAKRYSCIDCPGVWYVDENKPAGRCPRCGGPPDPKASE